jgi:hypothetical protein
VDNSLPMLAFFSSCRLSDTASVLGTLLCNILIYAFAEASLVEPAHSLHRARTSFMYGRHCQPSGISAGASVENKRSGVVPGRERPFAGNDVFSIGRNSSHEFWLQAATHRAVLTSSRHIDPVDGSNLW